MVCDFGRLEVVEMGATNTPKQEEHLVAPRSSAADEEANTGVLSLSAYQMHSSCICFLVVQRLKVLVFDSGGPLFTTVWMSVVIYWFLKVWRLITVA